MRLLTWVAAALVTLTSSCGENRGTPTPPSDKNPSADGSNGRTSPTEARLADGAKWKAQLIWDRSPAFSDEEFLEMTGTIDLWAADGTFPSSIVNVTLTADMPQHGHGTGNILPRVLPIPGEPGRFAFDNLFFTMTGSWRIRVAATVDGHHDVWTTTVDVK